MRFIGVRDELTLEVILTLGLELIESSVQHDDVTCPFTCIYTFPRASSITMVIISQLDNEQ